MDQMCIEDIPLSIRDYTVIKLVQVTRHQDDITYGMCRGMQCSCISLIPVSLDLQVNWISSIFDQRENFHKSIEKFRKDESDRRLATRVLTKNCSMNVEILENEAQGITICYLLQKLENSVQKIRAGALLIVDNYVLGLIQEINSKKYLLDSDSNNENDNLPSFGAAVLLKLDTWYSVETYIKSVYYNTYSMTLYFQV